MNRELDAQQSTTGKRSARWLGVIRDLWLILGVVLLLLLVIDAALKAWLPERPGLAQVVPGTSAPARARSDAMGEAPWADAYFAELRQARRTRWQPWTYWVREPFSGQFINVDGQGQRQSWAPPAARQEIWLLGGSTVWGTGARDEYTLPSQLARWLADQG